MGRRANFAPLLGLFMGDTSSTLNPDFDKYEMNDLGDFINKATGETVSDSVALKNANVPYNVPGLATKLFHPEVADQETAGNNAFTLAPKLATQRNDIVQNEWTKRIYNNSPDLQKMYPDPNQAYSATGNHTEFNATDRLPIANAQSLLDVGSPELAAQTAKREYQAAGAAADNSYKRSVLSSLQGLPGAQAYSDYRNTIANTGAADTQIATEPFRRQSLTLGLGNDVMRQSTVVPQQISNEGQIAQGVGAAIPYQNSALLSNSQESANIARRTLANDPFLGQAQNNEAVAQAWLSGRIPNPSTPLETVINAREGTVTPGMRAAGYSPFAAMNAMAAGNTQSVANTPIAAMANGQPVPVPPSSVYSNPSYSALQGNGSEKEKVGPHNHPAALADQKPLEGFQGYTYDSAGNLFMDGKKIEVADGTALKEAVYKQLHEVKHKELTRPAISSLMLNHIFNH